MVRKMGSGYFPEFCLSHMKNAIGDCLSQMQEHSGEVLCLVRVATRAAGWESAGDYPDVFLHVLTWTYSGIFLRGLAKKVSDWKSRCY